MTANLDALIQPHKNVRLLTYFLDAANLQAWECRPFTSPEVHDVRDAEAVRKELEELRELLWDDRLPSSDNFACTVAIGALMWAADLEQSAPVSGFFKAIAALRQKSPSAFDLAE